MTDLTGVPNTPKQSFISLVMNTGAGHHAHGHEQLAHQLLDFFKAHSVEVDLYLPRQAGQLSQLIQQARLKHERRGGVIVVAGGDGTLNTAAQQLKHSTVPMGIIPLGTFNYVARALNIPLEPFAAASVIIQGRVNSIHLGLVNGWVYLNNASIGLYPKIIERREQHNARFGRFRVVAMLSGLGVLLREQQKLKLKMTVDGQQKPIETPLVFFGNNQLQLQNLKLQLASCVAQGKLAAVAIAVLTRWQMLMLIRRLQAGNFEQAPEVRSFCATKIKIESRLRHIKVAIDGEIIHLHTPLLFTVARDALQVMVPHDSASV